MKPKIYEFTPDNAFPRMPDLFFGETISIGATINIWGVTSNLIKNYDCFISANVLQELGSSRLDSNDGDHFRIIISRFLQKQNPSINAEPSISTVFGQPDFLPFPFLSLGIRRGASVARILRKFTSENSAQDFIAAIRNAEELRKKDFSLEVLAEILCMSIQEVRSIFQLPSIPNSGKIPLEPNLFKGNSVPIASGFLVGRDEFLTNHHIFLNKSGQDLTSLDVSEYFAEFNYEQDLLGRNIESIKYQFEKVLIANQELDFALVRLKPQASDESHSAIGHAGDQFGWIPLTDSDDLIAPPFPSSSENNTEELRSIFNNSIESHIKRLIETEMNKTGLSFETTERNLEKIITQMRHPDFFDILYRRFHTGEPVNIIQHPKGRRKEVVLSNNRLTDISENFLLYQADTDFSSSGSPVMNQQWQLVGLHRGVLYQPDEDKTSDDQAENLKVASEVGIRMVKIVQFIVEDVNKRVQVFNPQTPKQLGSENNTNNDANDDTVDLWFFATSFIQLQKPENKIRLLLPELEKYSEQLKQKPLSSNSYPSTSSAY